MVYKLPRLNSDSMFMELTVDEDNTTADEEYVKAKEEELYKEYTELLADNEKID